MEIVLCKMNLKSNILSKNLKIIKVSSKNLTFKTVS